MSQVRRTSLSALVGAVGVVYGDIGTSPLYTICLLYTSDAADE